MTTRPNRLIHRNPSPTHSLAWLSLTASACLFISVIAGCGDVGSSASSDRSGPGSSVHERYFADSYKSAELATESKAVPVDVARTFATANDAPHGETAAETGAPAAEIRHRSEAEADIKMTTDERFAPKHGQQSGVLTAGSFDDVANYGDYLSFLSRHQHQASQCQLPLNLHTHQTVICLKDIDGKPLGNIRCVVREPKSNRVLLDRTTGTDGRVMLLTDASLHHGQPPAPLQLQVFADKQQTATIDEMRHIDRKWNVTIGSLQAQLPEQLDIALVVDTTGSMGDELEYLKTEIDSIVASVNHMFPKVDQRYSLVTYRDNGDQYVCRNFDFTKSLSDFRRNLDAQSANGGGDFPEAMDVALNAAGDLTWREGNTAKVLFLIGDAPPHKENLNRAMKAIQHLGDLGVRAFPVGASGVEATAQVVMRTASLLTMGQYLFLTDHSGIGNTHATPDVPEFAVERLDRLMIRMIASELAGKRLVADEVIAIEHGEHYTYLPPACTPVVTQMQPQTTPAQPIDLCDVAQAPHRLFPAAMRWLASHVSAVMVALIAGVLIFDQLTKRIPSR